MSVWISEALDVHHDLAHLDCAREELDRWLLHEALRAQAAGSAHTTVWTRPGDPVVVAFYSIAPTQFAREDRKDWAPNCSSTHSSASSAPRRTPADG